MLLLKKEFLICLDFSQVSKLFKRMSAMKMSVEKLAINQLAPICCPFDCNCRIEKKQLLSFCKNLFHYSHDYRANRIQTDYNEGSLLQQENGENASKNPAS